MIKRVLSPLLFLLSWFAVGVGLLLTWTRRGVGRIEEGYRVHVYMPIVIAGRWTRKEPTWKPIDLNIGIQPRTKAQIAYADACPDVQRVTCDCEDPECPVKAADGAVFMIKPPFDLKELQGKFSEAFRQAVREANIAKPVAPITADEIEDFLKRDAAGSPPDASE